MPAIFVPDVRSKALYTLENAPLQRNKDCQQADRDDLYDSWRTLPSSQ